MRRTAVQTAVVKPSSGQHPARLRSAPTAARPLAKTRTASSLTTRTRKAVWLGLLRLLSTAAVVFGAAAATFAATIAMTAARQAAHARAVYRVMWSLPEGNTGRASPCLGRARSTSAARRRRLRFRQASLQRHRAVAAIATIAAASPPQPRGSIGPHRRRWRQAVKLGEYTFLPAARAPISCEFLCRRFPGDTCRQPCSSSIRPTLS